jgi:hypothetical protein
MTSLGLGVCEHWCSEERWRTQEKEPTWKVVEAYDWTRLGDGDRSVGAGNTEW